MVTAIVIPILCVYFFWITKKEMKQQDHKWLQAGVIVEDAVVSGVIKEVKTEKQRFYYNRYLYVQELKLQTDTTFLVVKKVTPLTDHVSLEDFHVGEKLRVYGSFRGEDFYISSVEKRMEHILTPKR